MTIYLYKKTHNRTGLKYLGKTSKKDPYKYKGSGDYWTDHIKQHGYDVTTEIIKECQTNEEVKHWGLYYSELWNIVDERDENGKKTWANLKPEAGDGHDSLTATSISLRLVREGKHHFQKRTDGTSISSDLVFTGKHNLLKRTDGTSHATEKVLAGTHHLLKRSDGTSLMSERTEKGNNPFSKRSDGTSLASDRVLAGTHHLLKNGKDHPAYDHTVYYIQNVKTGQVLTGTRQELINQTMLTSSSISRLVRKRKAIQHGWKLTTYYDEG